MADAYTVGADSTIVLAAGSTADASDTVVITAVDNDRDEEDREVTVSVAAGNSQGFIAPAPVMLTIRDDESAPTLSIDDPSIDEGATGDTPTLRFTVSLSAASNKAIKVKYAEESTGRTATPGIDYTAIAADSLTFAAGETSKTIDVSVTGDALNEPDETVVVRFDRRGQRGPRRWRIVPRWHGNDHQ